MSGKLTTFLNIFALIFKVISFIPISICKFIYRRLTTKTSTKSTSEEVPQITFNADCFFNSGKKYKNINYKYLNKTEKEVIDKVIEYINNIEEVDYTPNQAKHIYLNKRLETVDFQLDDILYHITKNEKNSWDCFDDDTFWNIFGEGESEMIYTPPQ